MGATFGEDSTEVPSKKEDTFVNEGLTQSGALFKHPNHYRNLSKEQREQLTQQMMSQHRQLARKLPGMGKG
jgi:hypothetical protein